MGQVSVTSLGTHVAVQQGRRDVQSTSYIFHTECTSLDELEMLERDAHVDWLESLFQYAGAEDVFQWSVGVVCEVGFNTLKYFRCQSVLCGQEHLCGDAL